MMNTKEFEFDDADGNKLTIKAEDVKNVLHKGAGSTEIILESEEVIYIPFSQNNQVKLLELMMAKLG